MSSSAAHPEAFLRRWAGEPVQPARGDRGAFLLVACIVAAAPTDIWAPFTFASHGVGFGFLSAALLIAYQAPRVLFGLARMHVAVAVIVLLVPYGLVCGLVAAPNVDFADRVLRHALLFTFSVSVFAAASYIRFSWSALLRMVPLLASTYSVTVAYGAYQAFARRNGWPFAFLRVANPGLSTDPTGLQAGASLEDMVVYTSRASSFFVEPTNFGMYLGYGTAFAMALVALGGRQRRWGFVGLALTAVGFAANQSLTAVLVCGLVLMYYALQALATGRGRLVIAIVAGLCVAVAGLSAVPGGLDALSLRLARLSVQESSGRFTALPRVLDAFKEQPLGWGFAGHAQLNEMVHNGALVFLMDFGVVGALVLAIWPWLAVARWRRAVAEFRRGHGEEAAAVLFGGALVVAHIGVFLSSGIIHEPLFWSATGLGVAMGSGPSPCEAHGVLSATTEAS